MRTLPRPPLPPLPAPDLGRLLRLPAGLIPPRLHSRGMALVLGRLLKTPLAQGELQFLEGRILQVEVTDLGLDYRLTLNGGQLSAAPPEAAPDVRFGGNAEAFLTLALGREDPDTLFFQRRLQLEGDTELGLEIKNLLYSLEEGLLPPPLERLAELLLKRL